MPTKYSVTVHVDERWVKEWGGDNSPWKFCFGAAMGADTTVNVVANAEVVASTITVEWVENYSIAASKHVFTNGIDITVATNYASINFGDKYAVDRTWTDSTASPSPLAPPNGFLFQNVNTPASAVVAKLINGKVLPIYHSPSLLPPSGVKDGEKLYPLEQCAVWFSMELDTGTMIENDLSWKYLINMDQPSKTVTFDKNGQWSTAAAS